MASEPLAGGLFVVVGLSDDRRAVVLLVVLVVFFVLIVVGIARRHRVHEAPLDCRGKKARGCSWSCRFLPTVGRELLSDVPCSRNAFFPEVAFAGGCTRR
jgi:hypothetical protein